MQGKPEITHKGCTLMDIRFKKDTYIATFGCRLLKFDHIYIPVFRMDTVVKEYFLQSVENVGRDKLMNVVYDLNLTKGGYSNESRNEFVKAVPDRFYLNYITISGACTPIETSVPDAVINKVLHG